jgi:peptidoglycan-associated lipoprotein
MKQRSFFRVAVLTVAALAVAGACAKKPKDGAGTSTTGGGDFSEGSSLEGATPQRHPDLKTVYFDYDRSDIRSDQAATLKNNANAISAHSEWRTITIEGHCDERGSEEYNLALGDRRANAAKQYIVNLGVPSSKLLTVSLGESQPAVQGHDESAWKFNRRAEFLYSR